MHMIVYALVDAPTEDEALRDAEVVFDRLVGATTHSASVFDYYVTFDDDESTVAGKERWGDLPVAAPTDSEVGSKLVSQAWDTTKREFQRNLGLVKEALDELSDEEIMRGEELSRHSFHKVGSYAGPSIPLYHEGEMGIRYREQLDRLLEEEQYDHAPWIVPADVHF